MDGLAKNVTAASIGVQRCINIAVFKKERLNKGKVQVGRSFVEIHSQGRENHVFLLARPRTKAGLGVSLGDLSRWTDTYCCWWRKAEIGQNQPLMYVCCRHLLLALMEDSD